MKKLLLLLLISCTSIMNAQDISGGWTGTLMVQGAVLPLVFNFTKTATGYTATMDSPKQGVKGIPVDEVTFTLYGTGEDGEPEDHLLVYKLKGLS